MNFKSRFECPYCVNPKVLFNTELAMRRHVGTTHAKEALEEEEDSSKQDESLHSITGEEETTDLSFIRSDVTDLVSNAVDTSEEREIKGSDKGNKGNRTDVKIKIHEKVGLKETESEDYKSEDSIEEKVPATEEKCLN